MKAAFRKQATALGMHLLAFVGILCGAPTDSPPAGSLLLLDNGTVRIGLDKSKGASITWLSWSGYPKNTVNLDPRSTYRYRYWLIVGTEDEIATRLDALWEKHRHETGELIPSPASPPPEP